MVGGGRKASGIRLQAGRFKSQISNLKSEFLALSSPLWTLDSRLSYFPTEKRIDPFRIGNKIQPETASRIAAAWNPVANP